MLIVLLLFGADLSASTDEVVPAEREAAVQVASQLLKRYRVAPEKIASKILDIRGHSENEEA